MSCSHFHRLVASTLIAALVVATAPAFAAPAPATLTGTVYGTDVATPLPGATVVVTDVNGVKTASRPTGMDGVFTIAAVTPGRTELALETTQGTFAVATPVTLAPGQTKGVHLALKASGKAATNDENKNKKKGGAAWTGGEITALTVVLVGAAAATWLAVDRANEDVAPPASPYTPPPSN
jgi:hypothetical protein